MNTGKEPFNKDANQESFAQLFEESCKKEKEVVQNEIVNGEIVHMGKDYAIVDIGYKSEGLVALSEFINAKGEVEAAVGDRVDVYVENIENDDGLVELSKEKADKLRIWDEVALACEKSDVVEGRVIDKVKGGLSVDIGVKAFLPGSQIDLAPVRDMDALIGKTFQFKIIKFNKQRGNIVLSRRALLEKDREAMKEKIIGELEEGKVMKGIVKNITDYGVFIDLGGMDGLLHITDMSWKRVNHPSELVSIGQTIDIKILKYDQEKNRVSLGLKQISEDPWADISQKYPVGSKISGKVVNVADYGAFVQIEDGIEGLIHISEMSWTKRIKHPSTIVNAGDTVEAVILDVDRDNRRISLGMKQIEPNPWVLLKEKYPIGTKITGKIRNITDFGLFIGVEEGIDGLIHISDISWAGKVKNLNETYKKGDDVEAVVLNIDPSSERFSLGVKQLSSDPWSLIPTKYAPGTEITGEVMKVTDFGLFVKLEEEIEGLIHVSEISEEKVDDPAKLFKVGDKVQAVVVNVDVHEKKIGLSIKELSKAGERKAYKTFKEGEAKKAKTTLGDILSESLKGAAPEKAPLEDK